MEIYGFHIEILYLYYSIIIPLIFFLLFLIHRGHKSRKLKGSNNRAKRVVTAQANVTKSPGKIIDTDQFINVDLKIDKLIRLGWPNKDQGTQIHFHFPDQDIETTDIEAYLSKLLRHVQLVCPRLNVPQMTPTVRIEKLSFSAGEFVEEDGWIKLTIGSEFLLNIPAAKAILCHEVCHYILNVNGIREKPLIENERLTDVAMFVFGFGSVFLRGYKTAPVSEYRSGHRLGYLSDDEYYHIIGRVDSLWKSGSLQKTSLQEKETLLKASILDAKARDRLIKNAEQKYPNMTRSEIIQYILDAYIKDRR